jgi:hypothetical protein
MKKSSETIVKEVVEIQKDMNTLTVDKIRENAPEREDKEVQTQISKRELAKMEGIPYIEPIRKLPPIGVLPEKWRKDHARDWEYVKGIFENEVCRGEPIRFSFSKWPGDPDCVWEVPANRPVYVPRMIAKHLSGEKDELTGIQAMEYHSFNHLEKPSQIWQKDGETHQFTVTGTFSRGKFRALGAF